MNDTTSTYIYAIYTSKDFNYQGFLNEIKPRRGVVHKGANAEKLLIYISMYKHVIDRQKLLAIVTDFEVDQYKDRITSRPIKSIAKDFKTLSFSYESPADCSPIFEYSPESKVTTVPKSELYAEIFEDMLSYSSSSDLISKENPHFDTIIKDLPTFFAYFTILQQRSDEE